ncbi:MAG: tetratricopeptide repeat protein [Pyrinomonadaceae bacterium]
MTEQRTTEFQSDFSIECACRSSNLLKNLRNIIQSHPSNTAQKFGMSIIHLIEGDSEKMLNCLEFIIGENPNISLLHRRIAEVFINNNDYQQAIIHLENALEADEEDLTAKFWLGLSYFEIGNTKKARAILRELKEHVFHLSVMDNNWL